MLLKLGKFTINSIGLVIAFFVFGYGLIIHPLWLLLDMGNYLGFCCYAIVVSLIVFNEIY